MIKVLLVALLLLLLPVLAVGAAEQDLTPQEKLALTDIHSTDPDKRAHALTMLSWYPSEEYLELALPYLDDPAPEVRASAIEAIGGMSGYGTAYLVRLAAYLEDADGTVRNAVAKVLARYGRRARPYTGHLMQPLGSGNYREARAAAEALHRIAPAELSTATSQFVHQLDPGTADEQLRAIVALRAIGPQPSPPTSGQISSARDLDYFRRVAPATHVTSSGPDWPTERNELFYAGARKLWYVPVRPESVAAMELLVSFAETAPEELAMAALEALGSFGPAALEYVPRLRTMVDWNSSKGYAAQSAIDAIQLREPYWKPAPAPGPAPIDALDEPQRVAEVFASDWAEVKRLPLANEDARRVAELLAQPDDHTSLDEYKLVQRLMFRSFNSPELIAELLKIVAQPNAVVGNAMYSLAWHADQSPAIVPALAQMLHPYPTDDPENYTTDGHALYLVLAAERFPALRPQVLRLAEQVPNAEVRAFVRGALAYRTDAGVADLLVAWRGRDTIMAANAAYYLARSGPAARHAKCCRLSSTVPTAACSSMPPTRWCTTTRKRWCPTCHG
jgi:hypothetical protein